MDGLPLGLVSPESENCVLNVKALMNVKLGIHANITLFFSF